jgi:hypothetical protein
MKTITLDFLSIIKIQGHLAVAIANLEKEIPETRSSLVRRLREEDKIELESLLKQLEEADKNGQRVY